MGEAPPASSAPGGLFGSLASHQGHAVSPAAEVGTPSGYRPGGNGGVTVRTLFEAVSWVSS
ncbi:hypothetical protein BJY54_004374 [Streptomyces nodosus]|nr:hypothetical protein [Streptomyces nodosus]